MKTVIRVPPWHDQPPRTNLRTGESGVIAVIAAAFKAELTED